MREEGREGARDRERKRERQGKIDFIELCGALSDYHWYDKRCINTLKIS